MDAQETSRARLREVLQQLHPLFEERHHALSEAGDAQRLIDTAGDKYRRVRDWQGARSSGLLAWDGTRFDKDGAEGRLAHDHLKLVRGLRGLATEGFELALTLFESDYSRKAARKPKSERNKDDKSALEAERLWPCARHLGETIAWLLAGESERRIRAAVNLVADHQQIQIGVTDLDADVHLLNCKNGVVDLKTGELLPHDPKRAITQIAGCAYSPDATCPRWERFLLEVFAGDAEMIAYQKRLAGMSIWGAPGEQILALDIGEGANGKSVQLGILLEVCGTYGLQVDAELLLAAAESRHPAHVAQLRGKRAVFASEPERGRAWNEQLIKSLTGEDVINARGMGENPWTFKPSHTPRVAANDDPLVQGADHGFWRRPKKTRFGVTFLDPAEHPEVLDAKTRAPNTLPMDKGLKEALRAELPGILRWCVEGCREWLASGLRPPASVLEATATYREEQDVFGDFARQCLAPEAEGFTTRARVYETYQQWCRVNGEPKPLHAKSFCAELRRRKFEETREAGTGVRGWKARLLMVVDMLGKLVAAPPRPVHVPSQRLAS